MIRFPKRARAKSIDVEDGDIVEVADPRDDDPESLIDTGVVPPKEPATAVGPIGGTLSPVAMGRRSDETYKIFRSPREPRVATTPWSAVTSIFATGRPSLPWAAVLVAIGAIGAATSMRLLDAVDAHSTPPPVAAAAPPPVYAPLTPPAPPKPGPVVLTFSPADAVTVAVDPPKPPPAAAPAPVAAAPVVIASAKKPAPQGASPATASPPPLPADTAKKAQSLDSLAEQQLKAALK